MCLMILIFCSDERPVNVFFRWDRYVLLNTNHQLVPQIDAHHLIPVVTMEGSIVILEDVVLLYRLCPVWDGESADGICQSDKHGVGHPGILSRW